MDVRYASHRPNSAAQIRYGCKPSGGTFPCRAAFQPTISRSRGALSVDISLPRARHDFHVFQRHTDAKRFSRFVWSIMPTVKGRACTILGEFERAETELVGKAVILTDGKAGTVESVWLDEIQGLRISIRGHDGKWPVSTIKFAQTT